MSRIEKEIEFLLRDGLWLMVEFNGRLSHLKYHTLAARLNELGRVKLEALILDNDCYCHDNKHISVKYTLCQDVVSVER